MVDEQAEPTSVPGQGAIGPRPQEDFALVRPYVSSMGETQPDVRPAGRHAATALDDATMKLPQLAIESRSGGTGPDLGAHADSDRWSDRRRLLVVAACLLSLVAAVGAYLGLRPHSHVITPASPVGVVIPMIPTPSPSAVRTSAASVAPAKTPAAKRHGSATKSKHSPSPSSSSLSAQAEPSASAGSAGSGTPPTFGPGGANLAAGRSVTDSGHQDGFVASNAVDGNTGTYWEGPENRFPAWFAVDLGSKISVGRVVIALPSSPDWSARSQTLMISESDNGGYYRRLVSLQTYTFDPASGNQVTITFNPTSTRYLALMFTSNSAWPAAQMAELGVYPS